MDFFNSWSVNEPGIFSLGDLSSPAISSAPAPGVWQWSDQSTTTSGYTALDTDGRDSSNSTCKSSEVSGIDSHWGEKASFMTNSYCHDLEAEDRSTHAVIEKEPTSHAVQRRRIQNRNAQRNFRQRQEKERRMLVEKLITAEQQCNQLSKNCEELNSAVNTMRDKLKQLEAENSFLRSSVYSMPWRKDST